MTTQVFTRQELYDLVWTRAVSKVAPELGISDVALRKQCAKHSIPVPDARYWGRFHAGRKVERAVLPEAPNAGDRVVIQRNPCSERPRALNAAVEASRAAAKPVEVPKKLHPLVARTMALARKEATNNNAAIAKLGSDVFQIRAHPDTLERVSEFLNLLVHHALSRGYRFEDGKEGLAALVDGEQIDFKVNQTIRRMLHVPTDEEKQKQRRWDERNPGHLGWDNWQHRPQIPGYDFTPTGEMSLEIGGWVKGCQQRFADTRSTKIEQRIDNILDGFAAFAAGRQLQRQEMAERHHRAEEERARRAEEARLAALEQQCIAYSEAKADQLQSLERLQRLYDHVATSGKEQRADLGTFLTWLEQRLTLLQEQLSAQTMSQEIAGIPAFAGLKKPAFT